jgi:hypothetical protein
LSEGIFNTTSSFTGAVAAEIFISLVAGVYLPIYSCICRFIRQTSSVEAVEFDNSTRKGKRENKRKR